MPHKVIITCAVTGSIHSPTMSPYLPDILESLGMEIATPPEAREMLGLKGKAGVRL